MENKHSVLIYSSSRSLDIARDIQKHLEEDFDCTIWEDCFLYNTTFIESVRALNKLYDACIFIGSRDVQSVIKAQNTHPEQIYWAPCDNIIFEIGFYMGMHGINNAIILQQKDVTLPSDINGRRFFNFDVKEEPSGRKIIINQDHLAKLKEIIHHIADNAFRHNSVVSHVTDSYIDNYITPLLRHIKNGPPFELEDKKCECKHMRILFPTHVPEDINTYADNVLKDYKHTTLTTGNQKNFDLHYKVLPHDEASPNIPIEIIDFPRILKSCVNNIREIISHSMSASQKKELEMKEIIHFRKILEEKLPSLLQDEGFFHFDNSQSSTEPL